MANTLHSETLDVGASEKTIQNLLNYSKALGRIALEEADDELTLFLQN